jgi:hypothetical protein
MNTFRHIGSKTAQEFKVELKGAFEGKYRVFVICCKDGENEYFVFTDTKIPLHIYNQDLINLILETIKNK